MWQSQRHVDPAGTLPKVAGSNVPDDREFRFGSQSLADSLPEVRRWHAEDYRDGGRLFWTTPSQGSARHLPASWSMAVAAAVGGSWSLFLINYTDFAGFCRICIDLLGFQCWLPTRMLILANQKSEICISPKWISLSTQKMRKWQPVINNHCGLL